jgi:hypothetical protein
MSRVKLGSWIKYFIGICCIGCFLLLVWGTLVTLHDILNYRYIDLDRLSIMLIAGLVSGSLLFSTAGIALLTGRYREHKRACQLVWLLLSILAIILFLYVWIDTSIVR